MASEKLIYSDGTVVMKLGGLDELNRRLDGLEADIRRRMLITGMKRSMQAMLSAAESVAPVGFNVTRRSKKNGAMYSHRGGNLKRSFKIIKPKSKDLFSLETRLINTAYYAMWVEYGHKLVKGRGKNRRVIGNVAPTPFMRPAFEIAKTKVVDALANEIAMGLFKRGV